MPDKKAAERTRRADLKNERLQVEEQLYWARHEGVPKEKRAALERKWNDIRREQRALDGKPWTDKVDRRDDFTFEQTEKTNQRGELVGIGSLLVMDVLAGAMPGKRLPGNMFVPVDLLRPVLSELLATGSSRAAHRPWLGLNSAESEGKVKVTKVSEASPAEAAGLQAGDVVLAVDGNAVSTPAPTSAASGRMRASASRLSSEQSTCTKSGFSRPSTDSTAAKSRW